MAFQARDTTDYGAVKTFHEQPDKPGEFIVQTTFDRDPIIESCTRMRNEVDQRSKELRLEMRIPVAMFFEWMKSGKLSEDDTQFMPGGGVAVSPKKLEEMKREFSRLNCVG